MVRSRGPRAIASGAALLLLATIIAGCIDPISMEPDGPDSFPGDKSNWYTIDQWPEDTDTLVLKLSGTGQAWFNITYIHGTVESESGIVQMHAAPESREEAASHRPLVLDVLRERPDGEWVTLDGPKGWTRYGPGTPMHETAYAGVSHPLGSTGVSLGADYLSGWYHMYQNAALMRNTTYLIEDEPLLILLYAPGPAEYRVIDYEFALEDGVKPQLMKGRSQVHADLGRFPVGDGSRIQVEAGGPAIWPVEPYGISRGMGTPVSFMTEGPTLFFAYGMSTGIGTMSYEYQPPDEDPIQVDLLVEEGRYSFPRTPTTQPEHPRYGPYGGIGPGGTWVFHLHEEDCEPSSGIFRRVCTDSFHVADLRGLEPWDALIPLEGPAGTERT